MSFQYLTDAVDKLLIVNVIRFCLKLVFLQGFILVTMY